MSKNKTRLIVVIAAIVTIISTLCYAETEANNSTNSSENTNQVAASEETSVDEINVTEDEEPVTDDESTTTDESVYDESDVYEGDLFVFESDVTMDKLVDGNVFIIGNNVTITGQCSGNMFILGNNVTFDKSFIQASVFVCANKIQYNAVSTSLYSVSKDLSIDAQFGTYTDMYAYCSNFVFDGIIGRNAFIDAENINVKENALFYGDINYTSSTQAEIPEELVQGNITYTPAKVKNTNTAVSYISNVLQLIVVAIIAFLVVKLFTKDYSSKECSVLSHPGKTFGVGILSLILIPIIIALLLFTMIGATSSLLLLSIYMGLISLSMIILPIAIAKYLFVGKKYKTIKELVFSILGLIVLDTLTLIPYIGWIFTLLFVSFGLGIMIYTPLYKKSKCKNKVKVEEKVSAPSVEEAKTTESTDNNNNETNDK